MPHPPMAANACFLLLEIDVPLRQASSTPANSGTLRAGARGVSRADRKAIRIPIAASGRNARIAARGSPLLALRGNSAGVARSGKSNDRILLKNIRIWFQGWKVPSDQGRQRLRHSGASSSANGKESRLLSERLAIIPFPVNRLFGERGSFHHQFPSRSFFILPLPISVPSSRRFATFEIGTNFTRRFHAAAEAIPDQSP